MAKKSQPSAHGDRKHKPQPMCPAVMPSLHKEERESTWPTESSLGNKLHGTAKNLRLAVRFSALTGLKI